MIRCFPDAIWLIDKEIRLVKANNLFQKRSSGLRELNIKPVARAGNREIRE